MAKPREAGATSRAGASIPSRARELAKSELAGCEAGATPSPYGRRHSRRGTLQPPHGTWPCASTKPIPLGGNASATKPVRRVSQHNLRQIPRLAVGDGPVEQGPRAGRRRARRRGGRCTPPAHLTEIAVDETDRGELLSRRQLPGGQWRGWAPAAPSTQRSGARWAPRTRTRAADVLVDRQDVHPSSGQG